MVDPLQKPTRLLAVGDIHGHADKLEALLEEVQPTTNDKVIFLGDYIDRGPDSRRVIERLIKFKEQDPTAIFLLGNHEHMLVEYLDMQDEASLADFIFNGGDTTLNSYGGSFTDIPKKHLDFIQQTQLYHLETVVLYDAENGEVDEQDYLFVHAGVRPKRSLSEQDPMDILWIREQFIKSPRPMGDTIVVHGHTPSENVQSNAPYRIAVDSGVYIKGPIKRGSRVMGGKLTCCDVLTRQIWQV
jgi:serine/threonine protein phosphatase 1